MVEEVAQIGLQVRVGKVKNSDESDDVKVRAIHWTPSKDNLQKPWRPLPPSPIRYWDIASQIWCTLANPKATINAIWKFTKEFDPVTGQRVYGEFSGCEWWEEVEASVPEIQQDRHYMCPVSIFIDGAHLDNLGRMCV
jgi:hypothetical protein